jgi:hypothetical protein
MVFPGSLLSQLLPGREGYVGYRVITGGLRPDHATIARFRARHQEALGGLFSQVLRLLAAEGMVSLGTLSLDGPSWQRRAEGEPHVAADREAAGRGGCGRRRGRWPAGPNGASGWPPLGTGWPPRTRHAATRSVRSSKPGTRLRRPGNAAATAPAMSRAPTGLAPSRGRTSPTWTCG